jgi:hypothetical protein
MFSSEDECDDTNERCKEAHYFHPVNLENVVTKIDKSCKHRMTEESL